MYFSKPLPIAKSNQSLPAIAVQTTQIRTSILKNLRIPSLIRILCMNYRYWNSDNFNKYGIKSIGSKSHILLPDNNRQYCYQLLIGFDGKKYLPSILIHIASSPLFVPISLNLYRTIAPIVGYIDTHRTPWSTHFKNL